LKKGIGSKANIPARRFHKIHGDLGEQRGGEKRRVRGKVKSSGSSQKKKSLRG